MGFVDGEKTAESFWPGLWTRLFFAPEDKILEDSLNSQTKTRLLRGFWVLNVKRWLCDSHLLSRSVCRRRLLGGYLRFLNAGSTAVTTGTMTTLSL